MARTVTPCRSAMLGMRVSKIVKAHAGQSRPRRGAYARNGRARRILVIGFGAGPRRPRDPPYPGRRGTSRAGCDSQTVLGPDLLSRRNRVSLAVVSDHRRPSTSPFLHPVSSRRRMAETCRGETLLVCGQSRRQAADLLVGEKPLTPLAAIAPDAPAGVGALGPEPRHLGLAHDDRQDRHRPVCRDRGGAERGEPVKHLAAVDPRDRAAGEMRQNLPLEIPPVGPPACPASRGARIAGTRSLRNSQRGSPRPRKCSRPA